MNLLTLLIFISLLVIIKSIYNPIPIGAVIISTTNMIIVMQPKEYGGSDVLSTIYTAPSGITIIDTVYDPVARNLYLLFTNANSTTSTSTATSATSTSTATSATNATGTTNATSATNATGTTNSTSTANATIGISTSTVTSSTGTTNTAVYLCQLASLEQLDSTVYQLPITFNTANINNLNSFTADIINSRVFLTDQTGAVTLFSMSGLLKTTLSPPSAITNPLRSVAYSNSLNQLFMVTDRSIYACNNLDMGNLSCCEALIQLSQLRSIAFDQSSGDLSPYVLDAKTGIYQIQLNAAGCPVQLSTLNTLGAYVNLYFVVANRLYFASASSAGGTDNSYLVIANGTNVPRVIAVGQTIIALHLSIPSTQTAASDTAETCFNGITYTDYRVAVILAALFGTIMGVFMCFNALFCIDFFMTKRIIRGLKQQIPHNLLEDRWNRLVEEKYAKLALEKQRKKDDPPPAPRRQSSLLGRKTSGAATAGGEVTRQSSTTDSLQVPNAIPKLSAYIRRKSEDYLSRRRSDDPRSQRQLSREQFTAVEPGGTPKRTPAPDRIESLHEEHETQQGGIRPNLSRRQLLQNDEDFL